MLHALNPSAMFAILKPPHDGDVGVAVSDVNV